MTLFPRPDYDGDDVRAWLLDDERAMFDACHNPDISVSITVSVKLHEYRGKRSPKRLTPEQEERERVASRQMGPRCRGLGSVGNLLFLLAGERKVAAQLRDAATPYVNPYRRTVAREPKDLGILFRGDMVAAILAGQKRVTRRAMKPQPNTEWSGLGLLWYPHGPDHPKSLAYDGESHFKRGVVVDFPCRYTLGRRLWVRETWALVVGEDRPDGTPNIVYRAHGFQSSDRDAGVDRDGSPRAVASWRPSLLMPRWASRLTLRVTEVRAERLTEVTPEDVALEGLVHAGLGDTPADYCRLYRTMHRLPDEADPWLWRVAFEVPNVA